MSSRKNALYNVSYRVFSILLPLVTAPYLSRVVGKAGVGLYSYAWGISYVFVLIGMLGLADYGVRAIAQVRDDRDALDRTFTEIFCMQLLVAGITLLVWLGYVFLIAGEEKKIALHLTMMSVSCLVNIDWALMGLDRFKSIALRNTFVKLAAAAAIFLLIRKPEDIWIYGFVWSLATLVGCLLCWPGLRGRVSFVRVSWRNVIRHLPPCALLSISVMAVSVYRQMDKVMVGAIAGMEQNGLYENAEKIIYCLSGFISAIGTVMMPKVSNMFVRGETEKVRRHIDVSMQIILCMTAAMAFGVAAVATDFAPLFYGESFAYSGVLMIPLAFTLLMIGFANVIRTQWVLPQKRDRIFVISVSCGAIVNLIVNSVMIPRLQSMGAVVGTLAAEMTVPVVQYIIVRRELNYRQFLRYVLQYGAAGLCMLIVVYAVRGLLPFGGWAALAVQVAAGGLTYGAACLISWIALRDGSVLRLVPGGRRICAKLHLQAREDHDPRE